MQPSLMELVARVPHKRHRTGVANKGKVGYVRFNYACNDDCVACALLAKVRELQDEALDWRKAENSVGGIALNCAERLLALVGEGKV